METTLKPGDIVQFGRDEAVVKDFVPSRNKVEILRTTGASRGIPKFVSPSEITFIRSGPVPANRPPQPPKNTPPTQAPKPTKEPAQAPRSEGQSGGVTEQLGLF